MCMPVVHGILGFSVFLGFQGTFPSCPKSFSHHSLSGELVVMSGDRDLAGVNELRTVSMSGNKDSALLFGEGI